MNLTRSITGLGRGFSTSIVLLIALSLVVGLFFIIVPLIVQQISQLIQLLPDYFVSLRSLANQTIPAINA